MARPDGSDIDLDDLPGMLRTDAGLMLRATATAGGQIRRGLLELDRGAVARAAADGRPRGVVVAGMGGSGISGDVLLAVAGSGAPVPLQTVRSHSLPGWVGPLDVVVAVSCSGTTEETLLVAAEAARRGCRLVGVGAAGSALQQTVEAASGVHLAVDAQGLMPRASLWTLATPLLSLAAALGVATVADADLHAAADLLDEIARANGVEVPVATNEAKTLGLLLAGGWPMVWGDSALASVAAYRLACQLNENAKIPCVWGGLPEVTHNQIVAFDGRYCAREADDDLFRDPVLDGPAPARAQLVLLRDVDPDPRDALRGELARELAVDRGMRPFTVGAKGSHAVTRLASLVGLLDWASVYAALALGEDPSPIAPIAALKDRLSPGAVPGAGGGRTLQP